MSHYCCKKCGQRYDECVCASSKALATKIDRQVLLNLMESDDTIKFNTKIQSLEQEVTRLRKRNKELEDTILSPWLGQ